MPSAGPASRNNLPDQATLPIFRLLLVVQVLAAGFFGLIPLLFPSTFASGAGFVGDEPFIYRLAGAATLGYAAVALIAVFRPAWYRLRIPLIATLTFNAAAVIGALLSLADGETQFVVFFVAVAAFVFTVLAGYWLARNQGPSDPSPEPIEPWFRAVIALATLAAAFFGLAPLVAAAQFASLAGFSIHDLFIYHLAGAATLGYAVAGVVSLRGRSRDEIGLQVRAATVFNGLSAVAALVYVLGGGTAPVAWLILVAAVAFTALFIAWMANAGRAVSA
jgi:hypothetical protein